MTGPIAGRRPWSDDTWSYLNDPRMPAMAHGWKLHISARPTTLDTVTSLVLPVLARHICHAKWARDPAVLRELNSGGRNAASVGKAITVYPADDELLALSAELVALLRGHEGPQIAGDRRLDPDAPVYYRYGPFTGEYRTGRTGRLESVMTGPDGQVFDGLATTTYRCPPWARDPFRPPAPAPAPAPTPAPTPARAPAPSGASGTDDRKGGATGFGGGRYRVTGGIARKAQGNVYRAVDHVSGLAVVVKQARAYVAEDESGADTRDRLRNEHAVLTALHDAPGVPRAVDYFRHRSDEYLVMTSCGGSDLRRDVHTHGPYATDESGHPRSLPTIAARLLRILDAVHRQGVVVRDLKPDNVVLDAYGRCHIVDFGISALHGVGPEGSTPGYSGPVFRPGAPAQPADDYYALGATLHFAATGLDPVIVDPDPAVNRERTLACLQFALPGRTNRRLRSLIGELTSLHPAVRTAGADRLRHATHRSGRTHAVNSGPVPAPTRSAGAAELRQPVSFPAQFTRSGPGVAADRLAEIVEHTVAYCVAEAHRIADPELAARAAVPTPVDLYSGSAGLGIELLHHRHRPGVTAAVTALADWTARQTRVRHGRSLPTGLYCGRVGVDLFLAAADAPPPSASPVPPSTSPAPPAADTALPTRGPDGGPPEADLIDGVAGLGLGHLLLARLGASSARPARAGCPTAARHLAVAAACHDLLTTGGARLTPTAGPRPGDAALAQGLAHGDAGVAYFLLEYAHATGDPDALRHAELACARLATATPDLLAAANRPGATRRYGSWCRGLAGIGTVLARAADRLAEPAYRTLAEGSARTCLALAPRMPLVTRCCGLAGVGELMLELAPAGEEFHQAAGTVAALVLARSGGTPSRPVFPDPSLTRPAFAHATGSAGVLAFLRRLHSPAGPQVVPLP